MVWRDGWRSGARDAARHNGRQYDRGYQFRYPFRHTLSFGPWQAVWPMQDRDLPQNVLQSLQDGILIDGAILPIWNRSSIDHAGQTILGTAEVSLGYRQFSVILFEEGGVLKVKYNDGAGSAGTHTSAIAPGSSRISMAPWQRYIYFVSPDLGNVRRYSSIDGTFASIANSPQNGKFAFILNNNLVVIRLAGDIYEAVWSVDSLPEDWTSAGSGTNPLYDIGEVRGVGVFDDRAVIVGSAGAKVMVPTGGVPSFAFRDVKSIHGTPFDYGVAFSQDSLYYFGHDRQLRQFSGDSVREVGVGEGQLIGTPTLTYSDRLGNLVVTFPDKDMTLFLDPETGQWVSNLDIAWDFISDAPIVGELGFVYGFRNTAVGHTQTLLDLEPDVYTLPRIRLGKLDLEEEWIIDHVDINRTHVDSPRPLVLTLNRYTRFDFSQEDVFEPSGLIGIQEMGQRLRYYVNRPAMTMYVEAYTEAVIEEFEPGPFLVSLINSAGNMPVDVTNPPSGVRGDLDPVSGNLIITSGVTNDYFSSGSLNADGNLELIQASQTNWLRNTGIDRIQIAIKKQTLDKGSIPV